MSIVVAEAEGSVVCAAWIRYEHGTDFATLWGGATLADWRGQGIYKATVAYRAGLAAERGFRYSRSTRLTTAARSWSVSASSP